MSLTYHQALFDILELEPQVSETALAQLELQEKQLGFRFPEAIREWFSLEGSSELFTSLTNSDEQVALSDLKPVAHEGRTLLHVATENQGVYYWFVDCNGSDDPPVLDDDNRLEWDEDDNFDFSEVTWRVYSSTFSGFIFAMLAGARFGQGFRFTATDFSPDSDVLESLRGDFNEGPRTSVPEMRVYRFFQQHADLIIRSNSAEEIALGIAHWHLIAPAPDELERLAKRVWHLGTLSQSLQSVGSGAIATVEQEILHRLRHDTGT